jgi:hypothetical protein
MRITESQLRKVIRDVIKESLELDANLYDRRTGERLGPMKPHDRDAMDRRIAAEFGPDPYAKVAAQSEVTFDKKTGFSLGGEAYGDDVNYLIKDLKVDRNDLYWAIVSYCSRNNIESKECTEILERYPELDD